MGEQKRRKQAGTQDDRPEISIDALILARPADGFRPADGLISIIVDEPDWPLVAIQLQATQLDDLLAVTNQSWRSRSHREVSSAFFGAFHSWCDNKRNPVPGVPDDLAYASGMSCCFWMAFNDTPEAPGRADMLRQGVETQMQTYGAAAITMAILNQPIRGQYGKAPQTRRWMMNHGGEPTYMNHRSPDPQTAFLHIVPD